MTRELLDLRTVAQQLRTEGWVSTPPLLPALLLDKLTTDIAALASEERGGTRHLLDIPAVQDLARSKPVRAITESVLGERCFAVRGILFDKTPAANWKVVWHQDLSIAVRERRDVDEFGPWSLKEGVPHVQPPVEILFGIAATVPSSGHSPGVCCDRSPRGFAMVLLEKPAIAHAFCLTITMLAAITTSDFAFSRH